MATSEGKMFKTRLLDREEALSTVNLFIKGVFSGEANIVYSVNEGVFLFAPGLPDKTVVAHSDFERIQTILTDDPYASNLERLWDRQDIESFDLWVEKSVDAVFPEFENL